MIITMTTYGAAPDGWHRAEWVRTGDGTKAIKYETDYDVSIVLRNVAVGLALECQVRLGMMYQRMIHRGNDRNRLIREALGPLVIFDRSGHDAGDEDRGEM